MSDDRRLRDIEAAISELRERFIPVSAHRMDQLWSSVRETLDKFANDLIEAELARRGHSDTLAKVLHQMSQMQAVMSSQAVEISLQRQQINDLVVKLEETVEKVG